MNEIKVLQVIDQLNVGGAEKVFVDLCNILKENNLNVSALFLLQGGTFSKGLKSDIPIFELFRENKWNISSLFECSKIICRFDIVHCHFRHVYRYISLVKKIFKLDCEIILHDHYGSIDLDKKVPFLLDTFFNPKYYIGVSSTLVDWSRNCLMIAPSRTFLLENIVIKKEEVNNTIRKNFDLLLVSNIKPVKNNIFAVNVAEKCNSSLLIIGQNQNNEYNKQLIKSCNEARIDCQIVDTVVNAQDVMNRVDFGLHTSKSETGPLVLIEYLAQGLPFLAYETGEVAKILKPYFPNYFIDNFDEEQWVNRIQKIKNEIIDKELMQEIFAKHFSSKDYYKKIMTIYLCIIKN